VRKKERESLKKRRESDDDWKKKLHESESDLDAWTSRAHESAALAEERAKKLKGIFSIIYILYSHYFLLSFHYFSTTEN
jgi:hypothetical protein